MDSIIAPLWFDTEGFEASAVVFGNAVYIGNKKSFLVVLIPCVGGIVKIAWMKNNKEKTPVFNQRTSLLGPFISSETNRHRDISDYRYFGIKNLIKIFALSTDGKVENFLGLYGVHSASEGDYIRYGNFLNFPGPVENRDYSSEDSVSIFVDPGIKKAVCDFFEMRAGCDAESCFIRLKS